MKHLLESFLITLVIAPHSFAQQDDIFCKVSSQSPGEIATTIGAESLAVVLVDFPEGRKSDGSLPTVDLDTNYFSTNDQINSVGGMGYVLRNPLNPSEGRRKAIRKYVYDDYWDWVFSDSPTFTGTRHPDYDVAGSDVTTYGSLKDYYKEVSYNNLTIVPAQTWYGSSDRYHTGIINAIDEANGKKYIRWIMMPNAKNTYYSSTVPIKNGPLTEVISVLQNLKSLGTIDFDIDSYGGKILVIVAGGAPGGIAIINGKFLSVREKKYQNYESQSTLDGIWVMAHEYGHTLGFDHIASSTLDPMNPTFGNSWGGHLFSPQHFNPIFKLQKGWLTASDVIKVSTSMNIFLPSITASSKKVAVVTLYGDGGRGGRWDHSEYFVLEYRTRDGFNRFTGGIDAIGFSGGALVWHYSKYGLYNFLQGDQPQSTTIGLKLKYLNGSSYVNYCDANNYTTFERDLGNPITFFYSGNNNLSASTTPTNTNSGVHLATGISLSNFSIANNQISVNVNYSSGTPPSYSGFYTDGYNGAMSISTSAFIDGFTTPTSLTINDGSQVDIAPNSTISTGYVVTNGSSQNSIILRGPGYGNARTGWRGITLTTSSSSPQSSITRCLISGASQAITIITNDPSSVPMPIIANNQFQNCPTALSFTNYGTLSKELSGYDNNSFSSSTIFNATGKWNLSNTFTIPSSVTMNLLLRTGPPQDPNPPTSLQFASGKSLICYGTLISNGTSSRHITFDRNGTSGNWSGILFEPGSGGTLNNCNISNATYGVTVQGAYGSNELPPIIQNCSITNNVYGLYFVGLGNVSSLIQSNTISGNSAHGIYLLNPSNVTISGNYISSNGGDGICLNNCMGQISNNTITANNWDGIYCYNHSSPNIQGNHITNNGNGDGVHCEYYSYGKMGADGWGSGYNTITGNSYGISAFSNSNIDAGDLYCYGENSIYDVSMAAISCFDSWVYAEYNYWGGGWPEGIEANNQNTYWDPYLTDDPNPGSAQKVITDNLTPTGPSKLMVAKQFGKANALADANTIVSATLAAKGSSKITNAHGTIRDTSSFFDPGLKDALHSMMDGNYDDAIRKYSQRSATEKDPVKRQYILVQLGHCYGWANKGGFADFLNSAVRPNLSKNDKLYATTLELENYFLIRDGDLDHSIVNFNTLKSSFAADTSIVQHSLFGLWSLYSRNLKDALKAKGYLDELNAKFPKSNLTKHAMLLAGQLDTVYTPQGNEKESKPIQNITPTTNDLHMNFPNPFNPTTSIHYEIAENNHVTLKVYDVLGRRVATLVDEYMTAGEHNVTFDASRLSSGTYFYELRSGNFRSVKKMLLMK